MRNSNQRTFWTPRNFSIVSAAVLLLIWFLGALAFQFSWPYIGGIFGPNSELEGVFAPVSAFLSALATFGTLYVIYQQHRSFERQQFEQVFFNMLAMHQANRDAVVVVLNLGEPNEKRITSLEAFHYMFSSLMLVDLYITNQNISIENTYYFPTTLEDRCIELSGSYRDENGVLTLNDKEKYKRILKLVDEYFNNILMSYNVHLYHILKYIDEHKSAVIDERKYYPIIRAQLSTYELLFLYYHILYDDDIKEKCPRGIPKFQCYAEKSSLFHCLNRSLLFDFGNAGKYPSAVFEHEPWKCEEPCHKN